MTKATSVGTTTKQATSSDDDREAIMTTTARTEASPARAGRAILDATPTHPSPALDQMHAELRALGALLDDLERVRIMNGNRVGAMNRLYGDVTLEAEMFSGIEHGVELVEHQAELELVRTWRRHPLAPWAKTVQGAGEKTIARLVAEIGDPATRPNPAKLWAYCGIGDPARKRARGMTQEELFRLGNPDAKKRCWLLGEALVKRQCAACRDEGAAAKEQDRPRDWSPPGCTCEAEGMHYRHLFNLKRVQYADRVHEKPCVRCGPSGSPAYAGSPWSAKHQHEAAKRYAVKMFLRDMWLASRQSGNDGPLFDAGGEPHT